MNTKEIAEWWAGESTTDAGKVYVEIQQLSLDYLDLLKKWETFQIDITDVPVNSPAGKRFAKKLNEEFNKDHVLVPVEPSEEMTEAGAAITSGWDIPFGCVDIYKAMILANTKEGKARASR